MWTAWSQLVFGLSASEVMRVKFWLRFVSELLELCTIYSYVTKLYVVLRLSFAKHHS